MPFSDIKISVGLVPRVWPSPSSAMSRTRRPWTRCRRGLRWTSRSCLTRSISPRTLRGDESCNLTPPMCVPVPPHFKINIPHKVFHHLLTHSVLSTQFEIQTSLWIDSTFYCNLWIREMHCSEDSRIPGYVYTREFKGTWGRFLLYTLPPLRKQAEDEERTCKDSTVK